MPKKMKKKDFLKIKFLYDEPIPLTDEPLPKGKSLLAKAIHVHKNSLAEINLYIRLIEILKEIPQTHAFDRLSSYARRNVFSEEIIPRLEYIRLRLFDAQELCLASLLEYAGVSEEIRGIASKKLMNHVDAGDIAIIKLLHRHRALLSCATDVSAAPAMREEIKKAVGKKQKK